MMKFLRATLAALAVTLNTTAAFAQATLLPNAIQQFFDGNGNVVANGSVFFYVPNTTTPKTIWSDPGQTTPIANNPLQLNAAGRPSTQIYGNGSYREQVFDANNNLIWDYVTASTGTGATSGTWSGGIQIGTVIPWAATTLPTGYLYTAGQAVSRASFPDLLIAITFQLTIVCNSGTNTVSVSTDVSDKINIGAPIEAACFAPGTTVSGKSSGQITLSNNATLSAQISAVLFPWGNGDGATTFNVPDIRGRTVAGRDNMNSSIAGTLTSTFYGANPDSNAQTGGAQSKVLLTANLPPYTPAGSVSTSTSLNGSVLVGAALAANTGTASSGNPQYGNAGVASASSSSSFTGTAQGGTSTAFAIIQPSVTSDYIIKALADSLPSGPGVTSIQGMTGILTCGTNVVCTANGISVPSIPVSALTGGIGVINGGTGLGSLTSNVIYKGNGTSPLQPSALTDNGTTVASTEPIAVNGNTLSAVIASGTITLNTSAVGAGACTAVQTATATGTATTDVVDATFNADPTSTTGYIPPNMLTIIPFPTLNTVNFKVCNNTGGSITPAAVTLNWKVRR